MVKINITFELLRTSQNSRSIFSKLKLSKTSVISTTQFLEILTSSTRRVVRGVRVVRILESFQHIVFSGPKGFILLLLAAGPS
jgi:hypothetical protein